jgi:hypothetical protein
MAIAFQDGAMAWLVGMSWWWVADMDVFFATISLRRVARPLQ